MINYRNHSDKIKTIQYFKHFLLGASISVFVGYIMMHFIGRLDMGNIIQFTINATLYPFARILLDRLTRFIACKTTGIPYKNSLLVNIIMFVFSMKTKTKTLSILLCWAAALPIVLCGIIYFHAHRSKINRKS